MEVIDILYFVLAFCAAWITIVVCFLIWRIIQLIRTVRETLHIAQTQLSRIDQTVEYFKTKVDHSTSHLGGIARHIKDSVFRD